MILRGTSRNQRMKLLAILLLISSACFAASVTGPAPDTERLFRVKCASCHGVDGSGGVGANLKGKLAHRTTASIEGVIKNGIPGTAMPASPTLPEPALKKLALYVEYLNKKK